VPIQFTQKLLFTQQQLQQQQPQPTESDALIKNDDEKIAAINNNNNINNNDDDDYEYAPIIVAAGMGTTGTHLMYDATCAMNIASVHYRLNCHLGDEENNATTTAAIGTNSTRYQKEDYKKTLLEHHRQLTRMMLTMQAMTSPTATAAANNNNFMTPLQFKQKVLYHLEEIIAWGYHHHKEDNNNNEGGSIITLALHDAPYPLLIPSILKLVQKYFGIKTRPIILLSERNSNEWIVRRTKLHGRYTYVCRESVVLLDDSRDHHANSSSSSSRSLEGGAFDILGCIDKAQQQQQKQQQQQQQQQITRDDILYNLKEVQRLNQTQYVVDSMNDYQNAVRDLAVFNYNMFETSSMNRTSVEDLVQMIKNAMLEKRITWYGSEGT
jgi:hypothetical protein